MGKRPRTPHFITGIGDGKVNLAKNNGHENTRTDRYFRTMKNERVERLEQVLPPRDNWRDVFGGEDSAIGEPSTMWPWQISPFAILALAIIVVLSAIFLHIISGWFSESIAPYQYRRRRRQRRMYKTRKKKTDEWSDDEEVLQNGAAHPDYASASMPPAEEGLEFYSYAYNQSPSIGSRYSTQEQRFRRAGYEEARISPNASGGLGNDYYTQQHGVVSAYKSPSPNVMNMAGAGIYRKGSSPSPSGGKRGIVAIGDSGKHRLSTLPDGKDLFIPTAGDNSSSGSSRLPTILKDSASPMQPPPVAFGGRKSLKARPLQYSTFSSFESIEAAHNLRGKGETSTNTLSPPSSGESIKLEELQRASSQHGHDSHHSNQLSASYSSSFGMSQHQHSLLLTPGNYDETPVVRNQRGKISSAKFSNNPSELRDTALMPPFEGGEQKLGSDIPFIPNLDSKKYALEYPENHTRGQSPWLGPTAPPRSVLMDELRLVEMETGNSTRWVIKDEMSQVLEDSHNSIYEDDEEYRAQGKSNEYRSNSETGDSDISIPSGDPRKNIIHKRSNLTMATDSATSLQSSIAFEELKLQEVIGGGGFGQVWKARWRGTPVAVKILTGSAQSKHIAKAVLEEFKAEINLLKGMRHPNICLYMGACVDPPNRAIITELAANGSAWDALRLPLMPPFVPADGTQKGAWPVRLYISNPHGAPPSDYGTPRLSAPIPPKGTWPWELVKRVACGAARGMAYLHSGNPPVLHRDLKSANLLLDDSYTAKVCDFGLSRVKAQERSMTGNCGTVQWMAPEVLANQGYNEKADVYSFGIILWELLSRECPYDGMTAIQCALAVLNRDKRPEIPKWCPPSLHALIKGCVKKDPDQRPSFAQIILALETMN